jgi:hypothetical protein
VRGGGGEASLESTKVAWGRGNDLPGDTREDCTMQIQSRKETIHKSLAASAHERSTSGLSGDQRPGSSHRHNEDMAVYDDGV